LAIGEAVDGDGVVDWRELDGDGGGVGRGSGGNVGVIAVNDDKLDWEVVWGWSNEIDGSAGITWSHSSDDRGSWQGWSSLSHAAGSHGGDCH